MPGYRRFIAYIYDYLNGRKGNNCGYVKVELRGGICRMGLRVQPRKNRNEPAQAYGFVRGTGRALAIPVGIIAPRGGVWEYQMNTPEADFAGSGRTAAEIRGLWLKCGKEDYISVWDEEPVTPQMFALLSADGTPEQQPKAEKSTGEQQAEENRPQDKAGRNASDMDEACSVHAAGEEAAAKTVSGSLAERWEQFKLHYPRLTPFADGEIVQALSITLKDLVFLGNAERPYCSSPFVQRAFLRDHHLLLGLHQNGRFLLGVPGECRGAQDRYLARMYGFPYYKETGAAEDEEAHPAGYWYHFL